jgi:hypothetical protein
MNYFEIEKYQKHLLFSLKKSFLKLYVSGVFIYILTKFFNFIKRHECNSLERLDVLFVFADKSKVDRFKAMVDFFSEKKLKVHSVCKNETGRFYTHGIVADKNIPFSLLAHHVYAKFLLNKYQPKVIFAVENAGVFNSILRKLMSVDTFILNVAHGVGCYGVSHSNIDVDYSLVFGQSTIDGLKSNNPKIGSTKAVIVGSPFLYPAISDVEKKDFSNCHGHILIAGQYVPSWESYDEAIESSKGIIVKFIIDNPNVKFFIRKHPLDQTLTWDDISKCHSNLFLSENPSLMNDLSGVKLVLHMSSNVSIEAGSVGVPAVAVDPMNKAEHLYHEKYLIKVTTYADLVFNYNKIEENYDHYKRLAYRYSEYFLKYPSNAFERIYSLTDQLIKGQEEDIAYELIDSDEL